MLTEAVKHLNSKSYSWEILIVDDGTCRLTSQVYLPLVTLQALEIILYKLLLISQSHTHYPPIASAYSNLQKTEEKEALCPLE